MHEVSERIGLSQKIQLTSLLEILKSFGTLIGIVTALMGTKVLDLEQQIRVSGKSFYVRFDQCRVSCPINYKKQYFYIYFFDTDYIHSLVFFSGSGTDSNPRNYQESSYPCSSISISRILDTSDLSWRQELGLWSPAYNTFRIIDNIR